MTFNLKTEFDKWYNQEDAPGTGTNRQHLHLPAMAPNLDYWMELAFKEGAKAMWDEIDQTLVRYATGVEGLDPEYVYPCEIFDRARESLIDYVYQLELFECV